MNTSKLEYIDHLDNNWQVFAATNEQANIFHHAAWLQLMQECYGYRPFIVIVRDANGQICAGVPMMEINSIFTHHRWVSIPFTDHCAILYSDSTALRVFSDAISLQARKPGEPKIELRWALPTQSKNQTSSEHVLHVVQLESTLEKVAERIHHSHQRNIKIAQSRGVQIKFGRNLEDIQAFYLLHLETRRRQGIPVQPYHYFKLLHKQLINRDLGFILLAYENEKCLAGAVFLHWNHTLTYKYGASRLDDLGLRPNHLIFWNAIQWGCKNGFTKLDLGRSSIENTGLRDFKSRWGAEEKPLIYTNFTGESTQNSMRPLMSLMQVIIRKSPTWVCKLSGEILYKYFG